MSVIQRGIVFSIGTVANAVIFIFHSRVVLEIIAIGTNVAGTGPATSAFNLLPMAMQLAMGGLQLGLILYFLGGLGQERTITRGPM